MTELVPIVSSIVAVVCFIFALLSRRRLLETKALVTDAALRVENAQKQRAQAEQTLKNQSEQLERLRAQNQGFEKVQEETKQKLAERTLEWNRLKLERDQLGEKASLQREHLEEQVQVLTQQLAEAIREKKLASEEMIKLQKEFDDKATKQADVLRGQLKENNLALQAARREKQNLENQFEKIKEQYGQIKPDELKRMRLKLLRLEQLYTSMRGLREMAEERNRNWETALRYFAEFILQPGQSAEGDAKMPLGPLVGAALEKIGARLVEETPEEAQGDFEPRSLSRAEIIPGGPGEELLPVQL